jgi:hypothetical protein
MGDPVKLDDLQTPEYYREQIVISEAQYQYALDDFTTAYVNSKLSPSNAELQQILGNDQGTLTQIQTLLTTLVNDMKSGIDSMSESTKKVNDHISREKIINDTLRGARGDIFSDEKGSEIMLTDTKSLYNMQRTTNIATIVGILVLLGFIMKI